MIKHNTMYRRYNQMLLFVNSFHTKNVALLTKKIVSQDIPIAL